MRLPTGDDVPKSRAPPPAPPLRLARNHSVLGMSIAAMSQASKRRRVHHPSASTAPTFAGATLGELLAHLESRAPAVRVEALDALGAPIPDRGAALDDAAQSISITAEGAFIVKVDGLAGAAGLAELVGQDQDPDRAASPPGEDAPAVAVSPCEPDDRRPSRAHALLEKRARAVFEAANETAKGGGAGGGGAGGGGGGAEATRRRQLVALEALALWADAFADVFAAGDPANDGRIMAPDHAAGGILVPSRLLHPEP